MAIVLTCTSSALARKATPFRLGVEGSFSGHDASVYGTIPDFVSAWSKYVAAHGGLNGHPVKIYVEDDAGDASTALQDAQTLVQGDHVQALVDLSVEDSVFQSYIAKAGVPVTGGLSQEPSFVSNSDFFPSGGAESTAIGYGQAAIAKANGYRTFGALVCAESPICAGFFTPFGNSLKNIVGGMSLAYSATIAATAPNYTAQCLAASQAGVDAVFIGDASAVDQRVIDDCAQQNIKFAYFLPGGAAGTDLIADPNANGLTMVGFNLPAENTSTPGGKLFNQIITKYAPSIRANPAFGDGDVEAFAGLSLFSLDVTTSHLTPTSDPAKVKAGLYALKGTTLGGLSPELNFVKNKVTLVPCWFDVQIEHGRETTPAGSKAQCVPASKVAPLEQVFGA